MTTKKTSVKTNSPAPPATKSSKLRSSSKGTTTPSGKQKTTSVPVKKVNPWDLPAIAAQAPGKQAKTNSKTMLKQVKAWSPGHSPFFR